MRRIIPEEMSFQIGDVNVSTSICGVVRFLRGRPDALITGTVVNTGLTPFTFFVASSPDNGVLFPYQGFPIRQGNTAVLTNATTAPTLAISGSGTIAAGTLHVVYTYANAVGETVASTAATVNTNGSQGVSVTVPAFPSGATQANVYASMIAGGFAYVGSTTAAGTPVMVTAPPPVAGSTTAPPANNSSGGGVVIQPGGELDFSIENFTAAYMQLNASPQLGSTGIVSISSGHGKMSLVGQSGIPYTYSATYD